MWGGRIHYVNFNFPTEAKNYAHCVVFLIDFSYSGLCCSYINSRLSTLRFSRYHVVWAYCFCFRSGWSYLEARTPIKHLWSEVLYVIWKIFLVTFVQFDGVVRIDVEKCRLRLQLIKHFANSVVYLVSSLIYFLIRIYFSMNCIFEFVMHAFLKGNLLTGVLHISPYLICPDDYD